MFFYRLFIFTIISFQIIAQEGFEGIYVTPKNKSSYTREIFKFKKDGNFKYSISTCTGNSLGKGIYKIIDGDSLQLTFGDCGECPKTKDLKFQTYQSDSVEIDLTVINLDEHLPASGVSVYFPKSKKGISTENFGYARFKVKKSNEKQLLKIEYLGYKDIYVSIPPDISKIEGTINLSLENSYDYGEKLTFKIVNWSKSKLKLKKGEIVNTYHSE